MRRAELDESEAANRAALDTNRWEFKRTEWIGKHPADRHQARLAAHRDWRVMVAESVQLQELYNNLKLAYELIGIQDSRVGKANNAYQQAARSLGPNYQIEDALINYKLTRDEAVKNLSTWEEEYYRKLAFLEANYATREARVAEIVALDEALPAAVLAAEAMVDWSSDVSPEAFGSGGGTGTGFIVANGHVITCEHVISGGGNITVTSTEGSAFPATVVAADATNDWALLSVSGLNGQAISMLTDPPNVGSTIYCLGYPLGGIAGSADPIVGSGDIAAMQRLDGDSRFIQVTAPINPGNSGGPVLDQKGRWVGMVSQKLNDLATLERNQNVAQGLNFALKATFIGPLVNSRVSVKLVEDKGSSDRDLSLEEVTQRLSGSIVRIDVK